MSLQLAAKLTKPGTSTQVSTDEDEDEDEDEDNAVEMGEVVDEPLRQGHGADDCSLRDSQTASQTASQTVTRSNTPLPLLKKNRSSVDSAIKLRVNESKVLQEKVAALIEEENTTKDAKTQFGLFYASMVPRVDDSLLTAFFDESYALLMQYVHRSERLAQVQAHQQQQQYQQYHQQQQFGAVSITLWKL